MSPLPVPPHANGVLATATATGIEKSGEPAPADAWPISTTAAVNSALAGLLAEDVAAEMPRC